MARGHTYTLGPMIGRGGFGTVYCAQITGNAGFRKRVALKMMNRESQEDLEALGRMRDEARMLALVRHRAIVQVQDLILLDGRWTLVMEWVEGTDLASLIAHEAVPYGPTFEIAEEVAAALDAAWGAVGEHGSALRLVHRDIKPSNVRLTPQGEVKLLDFGTARATFETRESLTQGDVFGSMHYLAPERLDGEEGPSVDIWALGLVTLELLLGTRLRLAPIDQERHESELARLLPQVDPPAAELLHEMLAWEPSHRPSAAEVARRCRGLYRERADPALRDWARDHAQPEQVLPQTFDGPRLQEDVPPPTASHTFHDIALAQPDPAGNTQATFIDPATHDGAASAPPAETTTHLPRVSTEEGVATVTFKNARARAKATAERLGSAGAPPASTRSSDSTRPAAPTTFDPPTSRESWLRSGVIGGLASAATVTLGLFLLGLLIATGLLIASANQRAPGIASPTSEQPEP